MIFSCYFHELSLVCIGRKKSGAGFVCLEKADTLERADKVRIQEKNTSEYSQLFPP